MQLYICEKQYGKYSVLMFLTVFGKYCCTGIRAQCQIMWHQIDILWKKQRTDLFFPILYIFNPLTSHGAEMKLYTFSRTPATPWANQTLISEWIGLWVISVYPASLCNETSREWVLPRFKLDCEQTLFVKRAAVRSDVAKTNVE